MAYNQKLKKKGYADKNMHILKKNLSMLQGLFIKYFAFVIQGEP